MASKDKIESLTEHVILSHLSGFPQQSGNIGVRTQFLSLLYLEGAAKGTCPQCRAKFADACVRVNCTLGSLSEKARKINLNREEKTSKLLCEEHEEELKLFCEIDKKLICVICVAKLEHREHRFLSIQEAVETRKDQMKSTLKSLKRRKSAMEELGLQQMEKILVIEEQSQRLQSHITFHFAELHRVLTGKEQRLLRDLREEEARILNTMEKNLHQIQEKLNSIQVELSNLKAWIDQEDSMKLLKEEFNQKSRISDDDSTLSVADSVLDVGKFDHLYLLSEMLQETYGSVKRVSVTLDVETASQELEVSQDRKRIRFSQHEPVHRSTWSLFGFPNDWKKFTAQPCVLGSEGFTSGRHYWEVEVARSRRWRLGVATESVERKKEIKLQSKFGVWVTGRSADSFYAFTTPVPRLPASLIPGRVGVYLSYEFGTVSFYNAETKSRLYNFTGKKFTEKLYPFFWTRDERHWLRICCHYNSDRKMVWSWDWREERSSSAVGRKLC